MGFPFAATGRLDTSHAILLNKRPKRQGVIPQRRAYTLPQRPDRTDPDRAKRAVMLISQILRTKRPGVVGISPDASIRSAIAEMVRHHVGALVVVDEDQQLMGVVSEREIIQTLDLEGAPPA